MAEGDIPAVEPSIKALQTFYENEIRLMKGSTVTIYVDGAQFSFTNVMILRVLIFSPVVKYLILETVTGKVFFEKYSGFSYDQEKASSDGFEVRKHGV